MNLLAQSDHQGTVTDQTEPRKVGMGGDAFHGFEQEHDLARKVENNAVANSFGIELELILDDNPVGDDPSRAAVGFQPDGSSAQRDQVPRPTTDVWLG